MGQLRRLWNDPKELAPALAKSLQQDPGAVAVFDEGVKGIWSLGGFRAYDLTGDPGETDALAFEPGSSRLEELRALAAAYHQNAGIEASRLEFSETVRKELEALGYIQ